MSRKKFHKTLKRKLWITGGFLLTCWEGINVLYAQSGAGTAAISEATSELKSWYDPVKRLVWVIAGLLGVVGAVKLYNKFNSSDPESSKHAVSFAGGAVALWVAEMFIRKMFID